MTTARLLPYGPQAVLVEYESLDEVMVVTARFNADPPEGVIDVVPAERTVLVTFRPPTDLDVVRHLLAAPAPGETTARSAGPTLDLPVRYDGVDLAEVAAACAMTIDEVIHRHSSASYTVAFCGFIPGFAYLVGLDPLLVLPRRSTPRPVVEAGAVAIASTYSAVYPAAGPGGWHLLGRTETVLWRADDVVPAVLTPGTTVRFVAA